MGTQRKQTHGKPTTRRYTPEQKAQAVRLVRQLRDELGTTIGETDELQLASRRSDGTLRRPTTMWVVAHDDDLYVRSVNGPDGTWYRRALEQRDGHVQAGGVDKDVTLVSPDRELDDDIDAAYQRKYRRYAANIVDSITSPQARAATLRLVPEE
jgi:hypothetical protein